MAPRGAARARRPAAPGRLPRGLRGRGAGGVARRRRPVAARRRAAEPTRLADPGRVASPDRRPPGERRARPPRGPGGGLPGRAVERAHRGPRRLPADARAVLPPLPQHLLGRRAHAASGRRTGHPRDRGRSARAGGHRGPTDQSCQGHASRTRGALRPGRTRRAAATPARGSARAAPDLHHRLHATRRRRRHRSRPGRGGREAHRAAPPGAATRPRDQRAARPDAAGARPLRGAHAWRGPGPPVRAGPGDVGPRADRARRRPARAGPPEGPGRALPAAGRDRRGARHGGDLRRDRLGPDPRALPDAARRRTQSRRVVGRCHRPERGGGTRGRAGGTASRSWQHARGTTASSPLGRTCWTPREARKPRAPIGSRRRSPTRSPSRTTSTRGPDGPEADGPERVLQCRAWQSSDRMASGRRRRDGVVRRAVADRGGCRGRAHRGAVRRGRGRPARDGRAGAPRHGRARRGGVGGGAGSRAGREPCRAAAPERRARVREPVCGEAVLAARARLRSSGGRRSGGSVAARPRDADPAVDRATAVAEPHPPRRGAAGCGGRAGGSGRGIGTVRGLPHRRRRQRGRPGAGRRARRDDRDSRLAGGVQRDGVLPHHLADAAARPGRRGSSAGRRHGLPAAGRPAPRARDPRQRQGPVAGRRPRSRASTSPTSQKTSRPPPGSSGPPRIRGCRASLSSSSTPPTSPRSADSGSPHSDTPTTGGPGPATSTIRGG